MPKAGRRKRIKNPDDEDQWFDVPLVEKFRTEHGEGENRVVREFVFENVEPSNRLTRPRTVTHKARNVDGSPNPEDVDDESQRVVVELCEEFHTTHGRGEIYVKRIHQLETPERIDEPYTSRETHTSRIEGTEEGNTEDGWIDIERADKIVLRNYIAKETHELVWNDEEFNVTPDLPIDTDTPKDGYDPPWRLDPLQNVVNVKWKDDEDEEGIERNIELIFATSVGFGAEFIPKMCLSPNEIEDPLGSGATTLMIASWALGAGPFTESEPPEWTILARLGHPGGKRGHLSAMPSYYNNHNGDFTDGVTTHGKEPGGPGAQIAAQVSGAGVTFQGQAPAISGQRCSYVTPAQLAQWVGNVGGMSNVASGSIDWGGVTFTSDDDPPFVYNCHRAQIMGSPPANPNGEKELWFIFRRVDSTLP